MNNPEIPKRKTRSFDSFEDFSTDPKQEGLRPNNFYAGGDSDEIIIVNGREYRKEVALRAFHRRGDGTVTIDRPYTEVEYFNHSTEDVGPGPGWDRRRWYLKGMEDKGCNITASSLDPKQLSDLPLYKLIPVEQ